MPGYLHPTNLQLQPLPPQGLAPGRKVICGQEGFGAEYKLALTFGQFLRKVREAGPGNGYAIIEEGEFRVYIRRFEPRK